MKERERYVATGLLVLLLVLWGGFVFHRSPEFPGSLAGGVIGIIAALLMFVPLLYLIIKRVKPLKSRVTRTVSMRTMLTWHIYTGLAAPILALIHSGHRFDSTLGISMTLLMLLVVISGFTSRYLLGQISAEIREKQEMLGSLKKAYYEYLNTGVAESPSAMVELAARSAWAMPLVGLFSRAGGGNPDRREHRIIHLVDGIASVEYAIRTHETFKAWFKRSLIVHITVSLIFYVLLVIHIYTEIYFGLRWL